MPLGPSAVNVSSGERLINSLADCPEGPHPMSVVPDGESVMASAIEIGNKVGRFIGTATVIALEKIERVTEKNKLQNG